MRTLVLLGAVSLAVALTAPDLFADTPTPPPNELREPGQNAAELGVTTYLVFLKRDRTSIEVITEKGRVATLHREQVGDAMHLWLEVDNRDMPTAMRLALFREACADTLE